MQGGIDPELPGTAYFDLAAAVKQRVPEHARARLLPDGDRQRRRPHRAVDRGLPDQGPRGRARLASPAPPRRSSTTRSAGSSPRASCPPAPGSRWSPPRTGSGCRSSSTMMYGHVDNPRHWVSHLRVLRADPGRDRRVHRVRAAAVRAHSARRSTSPASPAPARPCATTSPSTRWPGSCCTAGSTTSRPPGSSSASTAPAPCSRAGANDVGGTLMEETISRMAGSEHGSAKTVAELTEIGAGIGRPVRERTTTYGTTVRCGGRGPPGGWWPVAAWWRGRFRAARSAGDTLPAEPAPREARRAQSSTPRAASASPSASACRSDRTMSGTAKARGLAAESAGPLGVADLLGEPDHDRHRPDAQREQQADPLGVDAEHGAAGGSATHHGVDQVGGARRQRDQGGQQHQHRRSPRRTTTARSQPLTRARGSAER